MKKRSIISFWIISLLLISNINIFADEKNISECVDKNWYELYKCQVQNVCSKEEYWLNTKKIMKLDKYYEIKISKDKIESEITIIDWFNNNILNIDKAKALYKKNQNNIYKCAILNSQWYVFDDIIKTLNSTDKSWILKERITKKLKSKKDKLERLKNQNKCNTIKNSWTKKLIKKIILDQSTFELCNYNYYLSFLDETSKDNSQYIWDSESISSKVLLDLKNENDTKIWSEKNHIFKMYTLAYDNYIQYDSFLKIHIMLELLKEDFRVYRDKLYLTLHPINQVVYKIINAQSK